MGLRAHLGRIRIVAANEQAVVRFDLKLLLDENPRLEVRGQPGTAAAVLATVRQYAPDVLVLALQINVGDGYQGPERLKTHEPTPEIRRSCGKLSTSLD